MYICIYKMSKTDKQGGTWGKYENAQAALSSWFFIL